MNDDWRLRIDLHDIGHARQLTRALEAHELEHGRSSLDPRPRGRLRPTAPRCSATRARREQADESRQIDRADRDRARLGAGVRADALAPDCRGVGGPRQAAARHRRPARGRAPASESRARTRDSADRGLSRVRGAGPVRLTPRGQRAGRQARAGGHPSDAPLERTCWSAPTTRTAPTQLAERLRAEAPAGSTVTVEGNLRAVYDEPPVWPVRDFRRPRAADRLDASCQLGRAGHLRAAAILRAMREDAVQPTSRARDAAPVPAPAGVRTRRASASRPLGWAARSPRSPSTRSCRTARRWRWSRRAARSSGCACRGSTRRACSARCSTATPARSGSGPDGVSVPAARRYLPGTMVLETSWGTGTGWIIVRDVLLIGRWHHEHERSHTHRRAPTDYDADHVLLRTVRCVNGEVQLLLDCEPKFDYGREPAKWRYSGDGYHEGVAVSSDGQRRAEADDRPAARLRGLARDRPAPDEGGRDRLLRAVVERAPAAARTSTRPTSGWSGPPTTGSTGSTAATSPTIRGASSCSAAR